MDETSASILSAMRDYCALPTAPMHMPGHKRNAGLLGGALPYGLDVTEVGPFDALHAPDGLLRRAMEEAAGIYGTVRTHYLVNGSTGGLLAGIRALAREGGRAVVAQNCHRAVFHALELCRLMPEYVAPRLDARWSAMGSVDPQSVGAALDRAPGASLVVITSPTYEGALSDIRAIADAAHARGAALLVDEAHGAHLPFSPRFPESALRLGADIVVQSVHKVLPSLTQTALLHICSGRADPDEVQRQLSVFETSSPSFILLASIDECVRLMAREGAALMSAHANRLDAFSDAVCGLRHLRVRGHGADRPHREVYALDRAKMLVSTEGANIDGATLSERLMGAHGIALEMSMGDTALAMSSCCDPEGAIERFAEALLTIDAQLAAAPPREKLHEVPALVQVAPIGDALANRGESVPPARAAGRVSREYIWAYPPGVPLLVPGARISVEAVAMLESLLRRGTRLHSTSGGLPGSIRVC